MEKDPLIMRIKKSLLKQVALSAKYGFDVKKHWEDMLASLEKEKKEEAVELTEVMNSKKMLNTMNKTKQSPPQGQWLEETPEMKAALYVHLAESGQITEKPLMSYEEALKWFQERMK